MDLKDGDTSEPVCMSAMTHASNNTKAPPFCYCSAPKCCFGGQEKYAPLHSYSCAGCCEPFSFERLVDWLGKTRPQEKRVQRKVTGFLCRLFETIGSRFRLPNGVLLFYWPSHVGITYRYDISSPKFASYTRKMVLSHLYTSPDWMICTHACEQQRR